MSQESSSLPKNPGALRARQIVLNEDVGHLVSDRVVLIDLREPIRREVDVLDRIGLVTGVIRRGNPFRDQLLEDRSASLDRRQDGRHLRSVRSTAPEACKQPSLRWLEALLHAARYDALAVLDNCPDVIDRIAGADCFF